MSVFLFDSNLKSELNSLSVFRYAAIKAAPDSGSQSVKDQKIFTLGDLEPIFF